MKKLFAILFVASLAFTACKEKTTEEKAGDAASSAVEDAKKADAKKALEGK